MTVQRVVTMALAFLAAFAFSSTGPVRTHAAETRNPTGGPVASGSAGVTAPRERAHRVIVYYFHTTFRCATCRTIEAYSREAIESTFADSIRSGALVFRLVNIDEKENKHFVKDYRLYTKSLVLVDEVRGRPPEWRNLEKIWELVPDRPAFLKYVRDGVRGYLARRS